MIYKLTTIPGHVEDLKECFDNLRSMQDPRIHDQQQRHRSQSGENKSNPGDVSSQNPKRCTEASRIPSSTQEICLKTSREPPVLTKPQPGEPLYLYLSAEAQAVGAALIREENRKQQLVYYISQVLKDAEIRYPRLEKFAFALVTTSRKLRHYFQGREIKVVTNQPLRKIIHKPDVSGRLVNWVVELSQFNLSFIPRTAIKAQALADFIIECNFPEEEPEPMDMD
ncbi:hypothetical protein AgCh_010115 [Apium graveolens]